MKRLPLVSGGLKRRLWAIIVLVTAFLVYNSLGDLIPQYWSWIGIRSVERSILALGFLIILLIALSGLAASDKLSTMAIRDGLTGLYNQTYIKARLQEELYRSERYKYPLSLLMIDLDDFKTVNDTQGHVVGDQVLKAFGALLQDLVRNSDVVGRYGGEEFLTVMPQTSCLDAAAAAERIRRDVAVYPFRAGPDRDRSVQITLSVGVFASPPENAKADEVIALADTALSLAKKQGKNKVVVFIK